MLAFLLFLGNSAFAEDIIFLEKSVHSENITSRLEFIEVNSDTDSPLNNANSLNWRKFGLSSLNFNFSDKIYIFRFKVRFRKPLKEDLFLVLRWKAHDSAELYIPKRIIPIQVTGDVFSKTNWPVQSFLYPTFRLQGNPGEEKEFIIKLKSLSMMSFPIELLDEVGLRNDLVLETGFFALSACLYLLMIFVSIFYYKTTGLKEFILYAGYALCMGFSYDINFGNVYELFWPGGLRWSERINFFFFEIATIFFFQFIRKFLETKERLLWLDRTLLAFLILSIGTIPLTFFSEAIHLLSRISTILYGIAIPLILFAGIYLQKMGNSKLKLFLFSWFLYMILGYMSVLYYFGVLSYSFFTVYAVPIIFPLDLVVLLYNIIQKHSESMEEKRTLLERLQYATNQPKYTRSKLSNVDVDALLNSLIFLMDSEKPYLAEKLQLQDVADRLGLTQHQLSELLNTRLGMNFATYINSRRIDEAKLILESGTEKNILKIAFMVGFGSKTSFNVEFKKTTGLTPKQYKESVSD
ncbi:7TM diverse intracellular signaling [Leptospira fainei serovar Hurstbridge str. BUT 6]|uniref:7TM diverse intracellular signaling n=1 Tax=Leptospira fainei serovar Hurstbridge str. BUT 6 TaxID=1193011 RepID=S3UZ69_9LEPT|nr:7TM diverse intracellular signaling domain-containing protein [Leptospira fainei]EPG74503.1 7TM diverse intracellular signaling [Leptospira fainei serovar Hurstbridge str. BUT 6]